MRASKEVAIKEAFKKGLKEMKEITVNTKVTLALTNSTYGAGATSPYPFWHMKDKDVYVVEEYPSFYVVEVPGYIAESTLPSYKGSFVKDACLFNVGTACFKYEPRLQTIDKFDIASGLFKVRSVKNVSLDQFRADSIEKIKQAEIKKQSKWA